jgi:extracellular solute-binding protein (family 5)
MNTELALIFTDVAAEYTNLMSASPSIDFPDSPIPPSQILSLINSPNFVVTDAVGQTGYYEIQFMLANNFWGCNFNFGNALCGVEIRQGIAHMFDKTKFTTTDPNLAGASTAIDNPVPTTSAGGLASPNPCGYDTSFPQSGTACVVGAPGGTAYHLSAATGANGLPWLAAPGSSDLNAAAQHFVNAGLATGFNLTTSVLTGISSSVASHTVNIFIRNDDPPRLDLGRGIEAQICYLFTGSYSAPCTPYMTGIQGGISSFPGFDVSITGVNLSWWMYTAFYSTVPAFDDSLYFTYNSRFVSGILPIQPPNGPCSAQAVPTNNAPNYMYLCNSAFDSLSSQMETAPCLTATGDPAQGATSNLPTSPGNGICSGTSQLSAISVGIQTEANFSTGAFTLPVFERSIRFAYPNSGWVRVINSNGAGLPNYFTWLNAWNAAPSQSGTIRQGFAQTTRSVNPYIASTAHDLYIVGNVYDSLFRPNPLAPSQLLDWMSISHQQLSNSSLTYTPPAGTVSTFRFTLRPDLYFQDGRAVTSYDVAFSYLSLVGSGSVLGVLAAPMKGITVVGPHQFDISVNSVGPFVLPNLASLPALSGRYWTNGGGSMWDGAVMTCTSAPGCPFSQYTLSGSTVNCAFGCSPFSVSLMTVDPADVAATFDPIANHTFVGSGPWQCGTVTSTGSGSCTSSGKMNPPVGSSYALTRFGNGLAPASSISGIYFRSSGNLALYLWSEQNNVNPFLTFVAVASCYQVAVNLAGPCGHFQQGIGNPGLGTPVGVSQVSVSSRFYNLNWVAPFEWATTPPLGIGPLPPILYEGSVTLNPASVVGCPSGYDC